LLGWLSYVVEGRGSVLGGVWFRREAYVLDHLDVALSSVD
jgi:hypothetical protein